MTAEEQPAADPAQEKLAPEGSDVQRVAERIAAAFRQGFVLPTNRARANALEPLRQWRDRLDDILQVVTDGVLVLDFTGAIVYANGPVQSLLGCELPSGLPLAVALGGIRISTDSGQPLPPTSFPALLPYRGSCPQDVLLCFGAQPSPSPTSERWAIVRCSPIVDDAGRVVTVIAVLRDATEQKRSEARLRLLADASEILNRSLREGRTLENIAGFLIRRLADGCAVHLVDPRTKALLQPIVVRTADPADEAEARQLLNGWFDPTIGGAGAIRVLASRDPELHQPFDRTLASLREHTGRIRPTSVIIAPLIIREEVLGALTLWTTQRAPFRTPDLVLASDLARRIALATDNERLYSEVLEQNARKDDFIALLGHELRNPLAPIVSALQLLSAKSNEPWVGARLAMMRRHAHHLKRLVDDLLDVSRIRHGKIELVRRTQRVSEIANQAIETVAALVSQRHQRVELQMEFDSPIHVDGERLSQVLGNLFHNASKFTPEGGTFGLRSRSEQKEILLEVWDTGCGFTPSLADELFHPFVQGRAGSEARSGLGLGLSLVRGLVALHGGSVEARSDGPGRGSTFRVRLPMSLVREESVTLPPEAPRPEVLRGARVLVVDDNVDGADALAEILVLKGATVRCAYAPESALSLAAEEAPQIVLLDIGLPRMDGHELAHRLRQMLGGAPYLLAVSGLGQPDDKARSAAAGCDGHLVKPVEIHLIEETLAAAMQTRARRATEPEPRN